MAVNQEPPCPVQAQQLKREVSETQINGFLPHATPSPLLRFTPQPKYPLDPVTPRPQGLILTQVLSRLSTAVHPYGALPLTQT